MGRECAPTLCSQHRQAILESPRAQFNSFHCLPSAQPSVGQPTMETPEDLDPFPDFSIPLPFLHHRSGLVIPDPTSRWAIGARHLLAPVLLVLLSWPLPLDMRALPSFEVP